MLGAIGAIRRVDSPTKQSRPYMSRASEYRRLRNGGKCRPEGDNFSVEECRKERYAELKISRKGPDYVVKRAALKGAILDLGAIVAEGGDVGPSAVIAEGAVLDLGAIVAEGAMLDSDAVMADVAVLDLSAIVAEGAMLDSDAVMAVWLMLLGLVSMRLYDRG